MDWCDDSDTRANEMLAPPFARKRNAPKISGGRGESKEDQPA